MRTVSAKGRISVGDHMATHEALRELRDYGPKHERITEPVVTIHALADEEAVLARIGLSAESCRSCDLWWAYESELVFVSVISDDAASVRFWRTDEGPHSATFLVRSASGPMAALQPTPAAAG